MSLCCHFVSNLHLGHCKFRSLMFTLLLEEKQIFLVSIDLLNKCMFTTHGLLQYLYKEGTEHILIIFLSIRYFLSFLWFYKTLMSIPL